MAATAAVLLSLLPCALAKRVMVMAGSPEDKAIQQIINEKEVSRRLPLIAKFAADFAAKPDMVVYAEQLYQDAYLESGDYDKSLEYGERALAADPTDMDVVMKLVRAARQKPDPARLFRYVTQFAEWYNGLETARPADRDETSWREFVTRTRAEYQEDFGRLEYVLLDLIPRETRPQERLQILDRFSKAFPKSSYASNVYQYYAYTYQQLDDTAKLMEYADKVLAVDPQNFAMPLLVAQVLSEQGKDLERATALATKALELAEKAQPPANAPAEEWQKSRHASLGLAHGILGFIHLRQNHNPQAISELKTAVPLVRSDPALLSTVLYRLGFVQAKNLKMLEEARATLSECSNVAGPFQQAARDLVAKIDARLAKP